MAKDTKPRGQFRIASLFALAALFVQAPVGFAGLHSLGSCVGILAPTDAPTATSQPALYRSWVATWQALTRVPATSLAPTESQMDRAREVWQDRIATAESLGEPIQVSQIRTVADKLAIIEILGSMQGLDFQSVLQNPKAQQLLTKHDFTRGISGKGFRSLLVQLYKMTNSPPTLWQSLMGTTSVDQFIDNRIAIAQINQPMAEAALALGLIKPKTPWDYAKGTGRLMAEGVSWGLTALMISMHPSWKTGLFVSTLIPSPAGLLINSQTEPDSSQARLAGRLEQAWQISKQMALSYLVAISAFMAAETIPQVLPQVMMAHQMSSVTKESLREHQARHFDREAIIQEQIESWKLGRASMLQRPFDPTLPEDQQALEKQKRFLDSLPDTAFWVEI